MTTPRGWGVCSPLESGIPAESATGALGAGWSTDYTVTGNVAMLRAAQYGSAAWAQRVAYVKATGAFTLLLNEPENRRQDNLPPADAARISVEWQAATRRRDAGGRWRVTPWGGLNTMVNELDNGARWEDAYYAAGGRVPPVRCVHFYGYSAQHIELMWARAWNYMHERKIRRPILVTECGLAPAIGDWQPTQDKAVEVMCAADKLLAERKILGCAWFSTLYNEDNKIWSHNNLLRADGTLTALGMEYRAMVRAG